MRAVDHNGQQPLETTTAQETRGHKVHTTRKNYQLHLNLYDSAKHIVVKHPILWIWANDR